MGSTRECQEKRTVKREARMEKGKKGGEGKKTEETKRSREEEGGRIQKRETREGWMKLEKERRSAGGRKGENDGDRG